MNPRRHSGLRLVLLVFVAVCLHGEDVPLPLKANSVRFAVIGDMGTGERGQLDVARQMVEIRQRFPFEFVIMLGDNLYGGSGAKDYEQKFALPYKPLLDGGVKFYAALGNHDNTNERFYKPFNMDGRQYYSFKKGNARFFVLDSNYMKPEQLTWLTKELEGAGDDWKIPYFHHPLYSSARTHGSATDLRVLLEPLFVKYGVQVVWSGHDHVYERVKPQKGIHYFVEGASGQLRTGDLRAASITAAGFDRDQTFMLVEIAGDELYFQAVARTGKIVDSGVIRRVVGPNAQTPPPISVVR